MSLRFLPSNIPPALLLVLVSIAISCSSGDDRPAAPNDLGPRHQLLILPSKGGDPAFQISEDALSPPVWSQEGDRLAWFSGNGGRSSLHIVDSPEFSETVSVDLSGSASKPIWSEYGRIAFVLHEPDEAALVVIDDDGTDLREVLKAPKTFTGTFTIVDWLSGSELLVVQSGEGFANILQVETETGDSRQLSTTDYVIGFYPPEISPDRKSAVWAECGNVGFQRGLLALDISSANIKTLSQECPIWAPRYSPDGNQVAFVGAAGVQALDLATDEVTLLASPSEFGETRLEWLEGDAGLVLYRDVCNCSPSDPRQIWLQPDGRERVLHESSLADPSSEGLIAFVASDGVRISNLDGSGELELFHDENSVWTYFPPKWSSDGDWVLVQRHHCDGPCIRI